VAPENAAAAAVAALVWAGDTIVRGECETQAAFLRDLFFNPFRVRPTIAPQVRAWNDGCVVKLATAIYLDRDFGPARLGILADALEEAGVTDDEVLGHCRLPSRPRRAGHVRGCWLVDLLLGRE
jgi:hypothetical protein